MEINTKTYPTDKGYVEGVQVRWEGFNILLVTGSKGFLACGVFDLEAIEKFGAAAALVESSPDNPIGNLERFMNRKIKKANKKAEKLGIKTGMNVAEAFNIIC